MGCNTVAMTLRDLISEQQRADLKIREIQNFDNKKYINGTKAWDDQNKPLNTEIEDRKRKLAYLKRETSALSKRIDELKVVKEALSKNLDEKETRLNVLEKEVDENKIKQDKELMDFNNSHAKNLKELDDEFTRKIEEAGQSFKKKVCENNRVNGLLKEDVNSLKMENECEDKTDACLPQCYLGEICLKLQVNMYHYVLPNQFAKDCSYRVKDIEEDIDDEDMLNAKERKEASSKWEELKKKIQWDASLVGTLKMLQKERDPMAEPRLDIEEAKKVADKLNGEGRLKGRTSYERVMRIIEMWSKSVQNFNL